MLVSLFWVPQAWLGLQICSETKACIFMACLVFCRPSNGALLYLLFLWQSIGGGLSFANLEISLAAKLPPNCPNNCLKVLFPKICPKGLEWSIRMQTTCPTETGRRALLPATKRQCDSTVERQHITEQLYLGRRRNESPKNFSARRGTDLRIMKMSSCN